MIRVFHFINQTLTKPTPEELPDIILQREGLLWIDLDDPTEQEEEYVLVKLFRLHPLVVEDARQGRGKIGPFPKLEDFGNYLFVIFNPMDLIEGRTEKDNDHILRISTSQLSTILTQKMLVTHHYQPIKSVAHAAEICTRNPTVFSKGPDYLFYLIIKDIVDNYLPILLRMDETIEAFEDEIYRNPDQKIMERSQHFRKDILDVRRIAYFQRELVSRLCQGEFTLITDEEKAYYRKVYNELARMTDKTDAYRDAVSGLQDSYLSVTSQSMNQVMKFLTIFSTIVLPLNLITGFYGMNLAFLPGANSPYSFIPVTIAMILIVGLMLFVFRKNKWL
jgi:magnesium transporter